MTGFAIVCDCGRVIAEYEPIVHEFEVRPGTGYHHPWLDPADAIAVTSTPQPAVAPNLPYFPVKHARCRRVWRLDYSKATDAAATLAPKAGKSPRVPARLLQYSTP